ncbi:hypothetical protein GGX14DRAFT_568535 [Mycena pura]|uniref:DUF6534 domain-containing protein n=1 Tax=Mycena pura TaxID=153505 RepID=A0AAD6Y8X6_9AGAR|nr:hypothetical protein GGX14DRAFT_568535 [Mycena pura]
MPDNLIHISFNIVVGKLYTNSLLASLNFREAARKDQDIVNSVSLPSMHASGGTGPGHQRGMANEDSFRMTANTTPELRMITISTANARDERSTHVADEKV